MFFSFGVKDFLDILLVAVIIYYIYKLMKSSGSINIFAGILVFIVMWLVVTQIVEMRLLGSILDKLVSVGTIALIVLFQEEIRKFLFSIGAHQRARGFMRFFRKERREDDDKSTYLPIVMACLNMSKQKVGALIVLERREALESVIRTGEVVDARVSQRLIENIFFKNSPLHDGAMVIRDKRIYAAGCILPVSHDLNIPKELGLRHRAALGISQETDAMAVIVSEETGGISVAYRGQFYLRLNAEGLESLLSKED